MLYPRESETREVKNLSGIWKFKADFDDTARKKNWHTGSFKDAINMPVPSSYNDITQNVKLRDHIGEVWYRKDFFAPKFWENNRIFIRIGSATHTSTLWVNGQKLLTHKGGYLPFEAEITDVINLGQSNNITLAVSNILDWTTLPPGVVKQNDKNSSNSHAKVYGATDIDLSILPENYKTQEYFHDFFNYSGIHRPVKITVLPQSFIDGISTETKFTSNTAIINYKVKVDGNFDKINIAILDNEGETVSTSEGEENSLELSNPKLWNPGKPYLYTFKAALYKDGQIVDIYRLPIGLRKVEVKNDQFLINDTPFYFKGFGKHEDMDIRGKALDDALLIKDFNLMEWTGANSFRTSHYPYAEEFLNMADELGIVVIDETPAVGQRFLNSDKYIFGGEFIGSEMLAHHKEVMRNLIERDRNHPSVVMWSIANEPASFEESSKAYFQQLVDLTRQLDPSRPLTIVSCTKASLCQVADMVDVICVNYYFSWYTTPGRLEVIEPQLENTLKQWYELYPKPIIMAEYGADTIAGFHHDPPAMFTEEYQCELLKHYHNVFDRLDYVIGEHVWNFADFATKQEFGRVLGNKKGVFTRQRQPKAAAHLLRARWKA